VYNGCIDQLADVLARAACLATVVDQGRHARNDAIFGRVRCLQACNTYLGLVQERLGVIEALLELLGVRLYASKKLLDPVITLGFNL
jgi:hypothetical protein